MDYTHIKKYIRYVPDKVTKKGVVLYDGYTVREYVQNCTEEVVEMFKDEIGFNLDHDQIIDILVKKITDIGLDMYGADDSITYDWKEINLYKYGLPIEVAEKIAEFLDLKCIFKELYLVLVLSVSQLRPSEPYHSKSSMVQFFNDNAALFGLGDANLKDYFIHYIYTTEKIPFCLIYNGYVDVLIDVDIWQLSFHEIQELSACGSIYKKLLCDRKNQMVKHFGEPTNVEFTPIFSILTTPEIDSSTKFDILHTLGNSFTKLKRKKTPYIHKDKDVLEPTSTAAQSPNDGSTSNATTATYISPNEIKQFLFSIYPVKADQLLNDSNGNVAEALLTFTTRNNKP